MMQRARETQNYLERISGRRKLPERKSKIISIRRLLKDQIKKVALDEDPEIMTELERLRPKTRGECSDAPRPCIFVSCKYHLYLDVSPRTGSIHLNFPDKEPLELGESCALDMADRGGITLEKLGRFLHLTRERIRQIETACLKKIKKAQNAMEKESERIAKKTAS